VQGARVWFPLQAGAQSSGTKSSGQARFSSALLQARALPSPPVSPSPAGRRGGVRRGTACRAPTLLSREASGGAPPCAPILLSREASGSAPPRAPTPLSHRVGEGLGVRANNANASHAVNLSSVPLSEGWGGGRMSKPLRISAPHPRTCTVSGIGLPRCLPRSCPQAASISCPRSTRWVVSMPAASRTARNRRTRSVSGRWNPSGVGT
jgi:hypothetical protein